MLCTDIPDYIHLKATLSGLTRGGIVSLLLPCKLDLYAMVRYDTIHGKYDGTVEPDGDSLVIDGKKAAKKPVTFGSRHEIMQHIA